MKIRNRPFNFHTTFVMAKMMFGPGLAIIGSVLLALIANLSILAFFGLIIVLMIWVVTVLLFGSLLVLAIIYMLKPHKALPRSPAA